MAARPAVTFYLLDQLNESELIPFVCQVIGRAFNQRQRIAVRAETQQQAEAVDETLWQQPVDTFIPHNLVGEGPERGTPVLIGWNQPLHRYQGYRQLLINLRDDLPEQPEAFRHIVDFVPTDEKQRAQARERFKFYRRMGCQPITEPAAMNTEGNHG